MKDVFKENYGNTKNNPSHGFTSDILLFQIFWIIEYHIQPKRKS